MKSANAMEGTAKSLDEVNGGIAEELRLRSGYERLTYFESMLRAMAKQADTIGEYDAHAALLFAARKMYDFAVDAERQLARKEQD